MKEKPYQKIKTQLEKHIPSDSIKQLPDKWEKIGNVLIIVLPNIFDKYKKIIGETYANILKCETILNDIGGIKGELREPNVELIYGRVDTTTTHKENGIKYKLDPQKVMFSSGNMDERIRMAQISNPNETVIDLFAGIGYFTLPIAVYSKPKKIYAVEKNPKSYQFLCENITLNNVNDIVEPISGDNRTVAPKNIAERVIMGYIGDTQQFLPTAIESLKNKKGTIHFHDTFSDEKTEKKAIEIISRYTTNFEVLKYKHVKSYAPGISHYVFDLEINEK